MRDRPRLRMLRAERRLSQMDTALKTHIGINRYWRIENGYAEPTSEEREALAVFFSMTEADVFPEMLAS